MSIFEAYRSFKDRERQENIDSIAEQERQRKLADRKALVDQLNGEIRTFLSGIAPSKGAPTPPSSRSAADPHEFDQDLTDPGLRDTLGVKEGGVPEKLDEPQAAPEAPDYNRLALTLSSKLSPAMVRAGLSESDVPVLGAVRQQADLAEKEKDRRIMADASKFNKEASIAQREAEMTYKKGNDEAERKFKSEEGEKNRQNLREVAKIRGENRGIYSNLNEEEMRALNNALSEGRLDPYKVNSRTAKIFANQEIFKPGTDWNAIGAEAAFERTTGTMNTKALLNAIAPTIDNLSKLGHELKNTMYPGVNKVVNFFKEQAGNPNVVAFNNARDDAIAEVERGLMGTGVLSDSKYLRAVKNIGTAQSPEQLDAALNQVRFVIGQRLHALQRGPNYDAFKEVGKDNEQPAAGAGASGGGWSDDKEHRYQELILEKKRKKRRYQELILEKKKKNERTLK
jgi:hypothetical protein